MSITTNRNTPIPEPVSRKVEQAIAPRTLEDLRVKWNRCRGYRSNDKHLRGEYNKALIKAKREAGFNRKTDNNEFINYLDLHYPGWRGYDNPRVFELSEIEYGEITAYLVVSAPSDRPASRYINQEVA